MRKGIPYVLILFFWAFLPAVSALIPDSDYHGKPCPYQVGGELGAEETWKGFLPAWETGLSWDVCFRQWRAFPDDPGKKELSGPFVLRFKVTEIHPDLNPVRVVIRVSDPEDKKKYEAALVFLAGFNEEGKIGDLALARYQCRHTRFFGREVNSDKKPHQYGKRPYPILTGDIFAPFDFPYMSLDLAEEKSEELSDSFEAVIPSPGFLMEGDVVQRVRLAGCFLELPEFQQEFDTEGLLEYVFTRRMDGAHCRQLWHPAYPWYVWAEGSNGRAELILDSVKKLEKR
jgi:hypothetical protein